MIAKSLVTNNIFILRKWPKAPQAIIEFLATRLFFWGSYHPLNLLKVKYLALYKLTHRFVLGSSQYALPRNTSIFYIRKK